MRRVGVDAGVVEVGVESWNCRSRVEPCETRVSKVESPLKQGVSSQVNVYSISGISKVCEQNMNPAKGGLFFFFFFFSGGELCLCLYKLNRKRAALAVRQTAELVGITTD